MSVKETAHHSDHRYPKRKSYSGLKAAGNIHGWTVNLHWKSGCEIIENISQKVLTSLLSGDKINKPCEGDRFPHKTMAL